MPATTTLNPTTRKANKEDPVEAFFGFFEGMVCPAPSTFQRGANDPQKDPDMVDYVFEHVESYVCADERTLPDEDNVGMENNYNLDRDNSLLSDNQLQERQHRQGGAAAVGRDGKKIKPIGEKGDVIDYVFGHVESYVCQEDNTLDDDDYYGNRPQQQQQSRQHHDPTPRTRMVTPPREIDVPMDVPVRNFDRYSSEFDDEFASRGRGGRDEDEIQLYFRPVPTK